jgi:hypothetical protein
MYMAEKASQRRSELWLLSEIIDSYVRKFWDALLVLVQRRKGQSLPAMMPLKVDMG